MSTLKTAEQICQHDPSPAYRKFLKQKAVKRVRRASKVAPEDAPKKRRYKGFSL